MFTGLIEHMGVVDSLTPTPAGVRIAIDPAGWMHAPSLGDSISINGCCLTVSTPPQTSRLLHFDAIPETLAKTTLGQLRPGHRVHLEHAATASTLMGGHIVQGHVDGLGSVVSVISTGEWRIRITPPPPTAGGADFMEYLTPKGSVCVQGVSLTIAALDPRERWFEVALIPTTLAKTTLGDLRPGDRVNLEFDVLAKTIVHWLRHYQRPAPPIDDGR